MLAAPPVDDPEAAPSTPVKTITVPRSRPTRFTWIGGSADVWFRVEGVAHDSSSGSSRSVACEATSTEGALDVPAGARGFVAPRVHGCRPHDLHGRRTIPIAIDRQDIDRDVRERPRRLEVDARDGQSPNEALVLQHPVHEARGDHAFSRLRDLCHGRERSESPGEESVQCHLREKQVRRVDASLVVGERGLASEAPSKISRLPSPRRDALPTLATTRATTTKRSMNAWCSLIRPRQGGASPIARAVGRHPLAGAAHPCLLVARPRSPSCSDGQRSSRARGSAA